MIAIDGMMMRDGAACRVQRVARRILDGLPLLEKRAVSTKGWRKTLDVGLAPVFETARMYTGAIPPLLRLERVFGVTTFELGGAPREQW